VLGVDPLSQEGMARWASEMLTVYASGLMPGGALGGGSGGVSGDRSGDASGDAS
jgi:hypothetical protein